MESKSFYGPYKVGDELSNKHGEKFKIDKIIRKDKRPFFVCVFDCGLKKTVSLSTMKRGGILKHDYRFYKKKCPNYKKQTIKKAFGNQISLVYPIGFDKNNKIHKRILGTYCWLCSRCYSKKHVAYERYGGLGIVLSERWTFFENFFIDFQTLPGYDLWVNDERYQLDKDVRGGKVYSKENCILMPSRQNVVFSQGRKVKINEKVYSCLADAAKDFNVHYNTIARWASGKSKPKKYRGIREIKFL